MLSQLTSTNATILLGFIMDTGPTVRFPPFCYGLDVEIGLISQFPARNKRVATPPIGERDYAVGLYDGYGRYSKIQLS